MHAQTAVHCAAGVQWKSTPLFASNKEDACPFNRRNDVKHDRDTS